MNPSSASQCGDTSSEDGYMDDWLHISSNIMAPQCQQGQVSRETPKAEDRGKLKSKLVSTWNSVKYGWSLKQKSHFQKSSPVTMLGHSYLLSNKGEKLFSRHGLLLIPCDSVERDRFHLSFASLLWLTYRQGFPQLGGCSLTTDSGWGCVLRTGQMLLAQALLLHLLPPGWTWSSSHHRVRDDTDLLESRPAVYPDMSSIVAEGSKRSRKMSLGSQLDRRFEGTHRRVVSWFGDHPAAPFGVHQLVELGGSSGRKAGDWYGPSIVAHILRKAVAASVDVPTLAVYVSQDCAIYKEDVRRLCERPLSGGSVGTSQSWKSVIILVPVRLGGQKLNPTYIKCVKKLLVLDCCIGIIGGRPKHSLFFVGFQEDHLLYLDPHYCQPTVDVTQENFPLESFHCKHPRKMSFTRMDPSCTIGFYAKGKKEFELLCSAVSEALSTSAEKYPMFTFSEGQGPEEEDKGSDAPPDYVTHNLRKDKQRRANPSNSMDEFVLL